MKKSLPHLVATALVTLAFVLPASSQILSNGTGGGSFSSTGTWQGGVVPTSTNFSVLANDTVTAESGVSISSSSNLVVVGSLTVNTGASITTTGRLNTSSPANATTTGVINIQGGSMNINRVALTTGGAFTFNVSSGSLGDLTTLSNLETFNISGGTVSLGSTLNTGTKIHVTGGSLVFRNGVNGWGGSNTWAGGRIITNTSTPTLNTRMGAFITNFTSNTSNTWDLSDKTTKQVFSYTASNETFSATLGKIQFDVYSSTNNDSDQIALTNGNISRLNFSSGVHFDINDVNLAGVASDYLGKSYQLLNYAGGYTSVAATIDPTVWTIGGIDYTVAFTNNLATTGTIIVSSLTLSSVPEPSTYALLAGMAATGLVIMRRRRY